jgi:vomeronasal 2 receptor
MVMSDICYNLYNAMYAVANTLHEIPLQQTDAWSKNAGKELEFGSWKVMILILNGIYRVCVLL